MSQRGQILIPGLVFFLGLLILFFAMVRLGTATIIQTRMDMAAQAAALSTARAQAQRLNEHAAYNLSINLLAPLKWREYAATEMPMYEALQTAVWLERGVGLTSLSYPSNVGHEVARLNGATKKSIFPWDHTLKLRLENLTVMVLDGPWPVGVEEIEGAYYVRNWGLGERNAQPTHTATWTTSVGDITSTASARVYLDIQKSDPLQNGGFPRPKGRETAVGEIGIQSFYPQFNARLINGVATLTQTLADGI